VFRSPNIVLFFHTHGYHQFSPYRFPLIFRNTNIRPREDLPVCFAFRGRVSRPSLASRIAVVRCPFQNPLFFVCLGPGFSNQAFRNAPRNDTDAHADVEHCEYGRRFNCDGERHCRRCLVYPARDALRSTIARLKTTPQETMTDESLGELLSGSVRTQPVPNLKVVWGSLAAI